MSGSSDIRSLASAGKSRFLLTRQATLRICEPLLVEDYGIQPCPDASPPKWHLAHTTWFFEEFILRAFQTDFRPFHEGYRYLFNSYYVGVGERWERAKRGTLSRPTLEEVRAYRTEVDQKVSEFLDHLPESALTEEVKLEVLSRIELGAEHEMQHQELLFTDILANFGANPLRPVYMTPPAATQAAEHSYSAPSWISFPRGLGEIGVDSDAGFSFDNERPRHRVYLESFRLADRLVTQGEYVRFIEDGGYQRPELWLSEGWDMLRAQGWQMPQYWERKDGSYSQATLQGFIPVQPDLPVSHVSFYEADAFARWSAARLPTEMEWEVAAQAMLAQTGGNLDTENDVGFRNMKTLRPSLATSSVTSRARAGMATSMPGGTASGDSGKVFQLFGELWQWTQSAYQPYPDRPEPAYSPSTTANSCRTKWFCAADRLSRRPNISESLTETFPRGHSLAVLGDSSSEGWHP